MNWDDVKYFLAVARAGQMLGAANRLGTSQAKLGRRITSLEEALNYKLFERSTTGCKLTPEGYALLGRAEKIETEFMQIQTSQLTGDDALAGTVRIGTPDGFGISFLSSRIHRLSERYPKLKIQLVPVPQRFSLSQREADIAIMVGRPVKGRLRIRKLTDYSLGLYASKEYLALHGLPTKRQDLKNHTLIGYVEDLLFSQQLNYNEEYLNDWNSKIEVSSAIAQQEMVRSNAGVGVLHDFSVYNDDNLVALFPEKKLQRSYWTVRHESMKSMKKISVVADFLDEIVQAEKQIFEPSE